MGAARGVLASFASLLLAAAVIIAPAQLAPAHASESGTIHSLLNQARNGAGLGPLARNGALDQVALDWAKQMAASGAMSHNPNVGAQIPAGWSRWGENVAYGYPTGSAMHNGWWNSAGHQANMLGDFTDVGIAFVQANGSTWGVQVFAKYGASVPAPAPPPAPDPAPAPAPPPAPAPGEAERPSSDAPAEEGDEESAPSDAEATRDDDALTEDRVPVDTGKDPRPAPALVDDDTPGVPTGSTDARGGPPGLAAVALTATGWPLPVGVVSGMLAAVLVALVAVAGVVGPRTGAATRLTRSRFRSRNGNDVL